MLRSAMMVGVIALSCVGIAQPADAQSRGFNGRGGFERGGRFDGRGERFEHRRFFDRDRFFFGFGGGYPYYPYYPTYSPYYHSYYPYYPYYLPYPYYPYQAPGPVVVYP